MTVHARYDGHADWYDTTFSSLGDEVGSAGLLARLLGPADPDDPVCVDVGCGTGLHFAAVQARGHRVVGVDVSIDQLRIAGRRNRRVVCADARKLPLADASVPAVVMTFIHTDVDDFRVAVGEAARVLRPGVGWSTSGRIPHTSVPSSTGAPRPPIGRCVSVPATARNSSIGIPPAGSRCVVGWALATSR